LAAAYHRRLLETGEIIGWDNGPWLLVLPLALTFKSLKSVVVITKVAMCKKQQAPLLPFAPLEKPRIKRGLYVNPYSLPHMLELLGSVPNR